MTSIRKDRLRRTMIRSNNCHRIGFFLSVLVLAFVLLVHQQTNAVRSPESYSAQKPHRNLKNKNKDLLCLERKTTDHHNAISIRSEEQQDFHNNLPRGGAKTNTKSMKPTKQQTPSKSKPTNNQAAPSIYWAVMHNWLYFLSLGFNLLRSQ